MCVERALIGAKHVQFDKLQSIAVLFIVLAFLLFFETDESLMVDIELVRRVLISLLNIVSPKLVRVSNLGRSLKHLLVYNFACQGVPEGHSVESVDSGQHVVLLLPREVVVLSAEVFELHHSVDAYNLLYRSRGVEQPDILPIYTHEGSLIAIFREIADLVGRDINALAQKLHVYCYQVPPRVERKQMHIV